MSRNSLLLVALLALSFSYGYAQCHTNCQDQECLANGKGKCDTAKCKSGFYLITGVTDATLNTCAACATGCTACTSASASACTACATGYILNGNTCQACGANCKVCTTTNTCTADNCADGYTNSGADGACVACTLSNCKTCNAGAGSCTACKSGFLGAGGPPLTSCTACGANCVTCTSAAKCETTCVSGFRVDTDTCATCGTNCNTCAANGVCTGANCATGYGLNAGASTCGACAANCYQCNTEGAGNCDATKCLVGYGQTSATVKTCGECGSNCYSCNTNGAGKCDTGRCYTGYMLVAAGDSANTCSACAANCNACQTNGAGGCNTCATGYALVTAVAPATLNSCGACATGCNSCSTAGKCDAAQCQTSNGYIYNATTQICDSCPSGCATCTNTTACATNGCFSGYVFVAASLTCTDPVTTASPVSAAFAMTPMQVINSSDTKWYKTLAPGSFTSGTDNTTILYHQVTVTGSSSSWTSVINRRVLNSTSLATTTDLTAITGPSMSSSSYVAGSGIGTYGILTYLKAAGNTVNDVQISVVADTATAVTTKLLTAMAATDTGSVAAHNLWYDEVAMIWYASWSKSDGTGYTATYIGGLNVSNGTNTVLYKAGGVAAATYGTTGDSTVGVYGIYPNNVSNSSTATLVYYKTPTGGQNTHYAAQVTLASGAGGSAASLLADATTAGTATTAEVRTRQSWVGYVASRSTYGQAIWTKIQTCPTVGVGACTGLAVATTFATTSSTVYIFFNSSSTSAHNYTLGNTDIGTSLLGTHYGDGYTLHYTIVSSTSSRARTYQNFFKNGTNNGTSTAVSLGTFDGTSSIFADANGALWLGWTNSGAGSKKIYDASVGQIIAQIFLSGNALSSVFAFIALVVAALFAF